MQNSRRRALHSCAVQEGVGVMLEDKQQNARTHTAVSVWCLGMLWRTSSDKHVVELEKLTIGKVSCDLWVQGYAEPVTSRHSMFMSNREKWRCQSAVTQESEALDSRPPGNLLSVRIQAFLVSSILLMGCHCVRWI
ncbi:hypothetical protein DPX16_16903 [Anabarilius grahami]|uniref:Uncharacterized protein n=1 Tax=Anabarilius grahami TaxID=495550 RepID=A0A3N0YM82_ANAGA|nr:hypothetical protein DPX16_16903 [Anabarilius grahami]